MRAKQSFTADTTDTTFAAPAHGASGFLSHATAAGSQTLTPSRRSAQPSFEPRRHPLSLAPNRRLQQALRPSHPLPADLRGEGLLHDARNLVSAIGLYCDLLSMPGVLKPEHKQYPEELRLLGTRSRVLIEHLLRSLVIQNASQVPNHNAFDTRSNPEDLPQSFADRNYADEELSELNDLDLRDQPMKTTPRQSDHRTQASGYLADPSGRRIKGSQPCPLPIVLAPRPTTVSLRATVERCRGLLSRVANGRPIEVIYGAAADVPVRVTEEAVERILVNLVRNASQALDSQHPGVLPSQPKPGPEPAGSGNADPAQRPDRHPASQSVDPTAIRISVGPLLDRIGETRSWPFQHVRLMVEDSGCGMRPEQLHSLLAGPVNASRGTHGIGFRVVRDLVAASAGELRAASTPGAGTRIQIEWPVAASYTPETDTALFERSRRPARSVTPSTPNLLPADSSELQPSKGAY